MNVNKKGTVADVTFQKYKSTQRHLKVFAPDLKLSELNKYEYQQIINKFAETHGRQTIIDFHHVVKASVIDALSDGLIERNPTIRTKIPKGVAREKTHEKYWDVNEYEKFIKFLYTDGGKCREDFIFLLIAKTGIRFAEAIGICPEDFDFEKGRLSINKTWDYKSKVGKFQPTKNFSSNREVILDFQTMSIFKNYIKDKPNDRPIFAEKRIHNLMVNKKLYEYCDMLGVKKISLHSLRHTYASLLLTNGVSIQSIANYLGHADTTVTQQVYLHLTKELSEKDDSKLLKILNGL